VARLAIVLRADLAAAELFGVLAERELEAILIRGPVIAGRLYQDGEREYSDCDVLVPAGGRRPVEETLAGLGFAPVAEVGHAVTWRRTRDGVDVDLHRSLWGVRSAPSALWDALADHRCTLELHGTPVSALDLPATAFVIGLHAAQHGNTVGNPVEDLKRALAGWGEDIWRGASRLAARTDSQFALRQALTMLPEGRAVLGALGLPAAVTTQAMLRWNGIGVPPYLEEHVPPSRRITLAFSRAVRPRHEIAAYWDSRAETDRGRWVLANLRRVVIAPVRTLQLWRSWRRARVEARALDR
jgi:hypothetical protein